MIIGSKNNTRSVNFDMIDGVVIDGEQLEYCKSFKSLGVIFDENMTLSTIKRSYSRKNGVLSRIRHTRHIMPNYVKRDVSTALIDPILSYDDVITYGWGAHGSINQENRILIADNDKLRYIFSLKRNDHISEYRKQINGLTPESRAKLNSATQTSDSHIFE